MLHCPFFINRRLNTCIICKEILIQFRNIQQLNCDKWIVLLWNIHQVSVSESTIYKKMTWDHLHLHFNYFWSVSLGILLSNEKRNECPVVWNPCHCHCDNCKQMYLLRSDHIIVTVMKTFNSKTRQRVHPLSAMVCGASVLVFTCSKIPPNLTHISPFTMATIWTSKPKVWWFFKDGIKQNSIVPNQQCWWV